MRIKLALAAALALCLPIAGGARQAILSPEESDPVRMGWMQGSPPPADKVIRFEDGNFAQFPRSRWSFAHYRELLPTVGISRGSGPIAPLPVALRPDVARLTFVPPGQSKPVSWVQAFDDIYSDAFLVMHRGKIVYEKYNGVMNRDQPHILFSLTKSFYGTLAEMLIAEGKLDENATVARYLPELARSGFGDATIRQVLDMTTSLDYNEDAPDADTKMPRFTLSAGLHPLPPGYDGPRTTFELLKEVKKVDAHGQRFDYQSVDTQALGFIIARVTGKSAAKVLEERIWSRIGAEHDGGMLIDPAGMAFTAGGFNTTLRDLARFGEMIRLGGRWNGQQIVPASVIAKIRLGGSQQAFAKAIWDYDTRRGWSYKSQWWITHNANGAFMGIGLSGQALYIDPKAEMVVVRFMSNPSGSTIPFDSLSQAAYSALADHLIRTSPPRGRRSSR